MSKLEKVLNYMEDNFEGSLDEIVEDGIEKIEAEGWDQEVWDEVKHNIIRTKFRKQKLSGKRRKTLKRKKEDVDEENASNLVQVNYEAQTMPYPYNGKWYDLMNLTKQEIIEISEEYDDRAKSNAFERDFLKEIAYRLDDYEQQVKEKFDYGDIRELRSEIKVKEKQLAI